MRDSIELPDGGSYKVDHAEKNKIRIKTGGGNGELLTLQGTVVTAPIDIEGLSDAGLTALANSIAHHDQIVRCPSCQERNHLENMRKYSFAGAICETCWNHCACRECDTDDWVHTKHHSARRDDWKRCPHCKKKFVTELSTV
jgi:hypothetical protein